MATRLALIAAAGALGALARYGLAGAVQRALGPSFAWGTLAVNALGCFLFGLVWTLAEERLVISGEARTVILVGFMGAFTTFSTYAFESGELLRDGEWLLAAANVASHVVLGILLLFAGMALGQRL